MDNIDIIRRDLAAAFVLADRFGFSEGICNHFSAVLPGDNEHYLINPFGVHWSKMKPEKLLVIDSNGNIVEGQGEVEATALFIHVAGHKANPRHKILLHTHMPHATALTMVEGGKLEMAHQTAASFYGRMAHHGFGGLALDDAEGKRIAKAQRDNPDIDILFLDNHGITIGGESVAVAFDDLYYLERACRQQILAQSTGLPLKLINDEVVRETRRQIGLIKKSMAESHFSALLEDINFK
ncbi:MAG: ribulose-5-phosphate 4-epimerase/fuculose-1-phosphate aldolase [Gammaproteobacteria bacterium]|jgi:ribulose-5-phosphate 4-epimerase/fuculose-1-phosphate aldolase